MEDFVIGVPYSGCQYNSEVVVAREDEALAIAFGAYLGGKNPLVFLQNSGIGNILDILTGILIPGLVKIPLYIDHRDSPEQHKVLGDSWKQIMKDIGYETYTSNK